MLCEIYCEQFHQKRIELSSNLNVVLGTNTGDNSIGKSTFMLIVDFVFGGDTYSKSTDILKNVGAHDVFFKFCFDNQNHYFSRSNIESNIVWRCDENYNKLHELTKQDYCKWLAERYGLDLPDLNFRDAVGRYARVYGKKNHDETKPLHYAPAESDNMTLLAILKLFDRYSVIAKMQEQYDQTYNKLKTFNKAQSMDFVSKITKTQYKRNTAEIEKLKAEISDLSSRLEKGLLDVDAEASEEAIRIKSELSRAKRLRSKMKSRLKLLNENGDYKFSDTTDAYIELSEYFPQVNLKHLEEVENFHTKVALIFKTQIVGEKNKHKKAIEEYDSIIECYETQLKELIQNPKLSKIILQRHADALKNIERMEKENSAYETSVMLKEEKKQAKERLLTIKREQLAIIESAINAEMNRINTMLYNDAYNAPILYISDNSYSFITPDDTGTGIAYKGLVVFDLAILHLTRLPILVHDSVVLKQISDEAIEKILIQYIASDKQTIIALDKPESYSSKTAELLEKHSILKLKPNGEELFGRSWGKKSG